MIQGVVAIAALSIFFHAYNLFATEFKATVTRVIDGDSLEVSHDDRALTIRLHGVDAPERSANLTDALPWLRSFAKYLGKSSE